MSRVTKTIKLANTAHLVDRLIRLLFSVGLISVLFMPWYPAFISPDPSDIPLLGWMLLLVSPFYLMVLFSNALHPSFSLFLIIAISHFLPWGTLILSILNLILAVFYRRPLMIINLLVLALAVVTTLVTPLLFIIENAFAGLLFGFWFYLFLLLVIVLYEIVSINTIRHRWL
jgi:hypothetical protein